MEWPIESVQLKLSLRKLMIVILLMVTMLLSTDCSGVVARLRDAAAVVSAVNYCEPTFEVRTLVTI